MSRIAMFTPVVLSPVASPLSATQPFNTSANPVLVTLPLSQQPSLGLSQGQSAGMAPNGQSVQQLMTAVAGLLNAIVQSFKPGAQADLSNSSQLSSTSDFSNYDEEASGYLTGGTQPQATYEPNGGAGYLMGGYEPSGYDSGSDGYLVGNYGPTGYDDGASYLAGGYDPSGYDNGATNYVKVGNQPAYTLPGQPQAYPQEQPQTYYAPQKPQVYYHPQKPQVHYPPQKPPVFCLPQPQVYCPPQKPPVFCLPQKPQKPPVYCLPQKPQKPPVYCMPQKPQKPPSFCLPEIELPKIKLPKIELPDIKLPKIELPAPPAPPPAAPPAPPVPPQEGGHWGDPHFDGFDGEKYDVYGEPGKTYNILSDQNIQYNGRIKAGRNPGSTVYEELGFQIGDSKLRFGLGTDAPVLEGEPPLAEGETRDIGGAQVKWEGGTLTVTTPEYSFEIIKSDDQGEPCMDAKVHVIGDVTADKVNPHGLLGQTADNDKDPHGALEGDQGQDAQGGGVIDTINGEGKAVISGHGDKDAFRLYEIKGEGLDALYGKSENQFNRFAPGPSLGTGSSSGSGLFNFLPPEVKQFIPPEVQNFKLPSIGDLVPPDIKKLLPFPI